MALPIPVLSILFVAICFQGHSSKFDGSHPSDDAFVALSGKLVSSSDSEFVRTDWLIFAVEEQVVVSLANGRKVNRRFKSANADCVELFDARKRVHVIPWGEIRSIRSKKRGMGNSEGRKGRPRLGEAGMAVGEIIGVSVGVMLVGGVAVLSVLYIY
jgi:hypothetical protein